MDGLCSVSSCSDSWGRCLDKQQASFLVGYGNHNNSGFAWTFFGTPESHRTSGKAARVVEEGVGSLLSLLSWPGHCCPQATMCSTCRISRNDCLKGCNRCTELFQGPVLSQFPPTHSCLHPCMPRSITHTLEPCIQQGPCTPSLEQVRSAPYPFSIRSLVLGTNGPTHPDNHSTDLL